MKLLKLTLALLLVFSLTGCSTNDTTVNDNDNINNGSDLVENTDDSSNIDNSSSDEKTQISMGNWTESVYTNDFLGIKYTLPENWISYSDEEIANLMNIGNELAYGEDEFMKKVAELNSIYFIFTQNPTNGNNVSLIAEKTLVDVDVNYYIDQLKTQLSTIDTIKYEIGETSTMKIGNKECSTLEVSAPDYNLVQKYIVYKLDNYFVGIVATSATGEEGINEIVNCFE